ncbi:MAG: PKD repeat protein [Polaribacter sp.]|jgi:PKD repeat protein
MNSFNFTQRNKAVLGLFLLVFLLSASSTFAGSTSSNDEVAVNCLAAFETQMVDNSSPSVGTITVHNSSQGDYDHLSWDFGDGNFSSSINNSIEHSYANSGIYNVSLTIWSDDGNCQASTSKVISIVVSNDVCDLSDCVWPGDANKDGKADSYDVMHMGLGFGATGPARNGDPEEWYGQMGADWDLETPDGVNYKHLDTNGDGVINEFDMIPTIGHYTPMEETFNYTEEDGPRVTIDFDIDTFVINQSSGDYAYISAALMIGDADNPIEDLHGLSLFLDYDTTLTEASAGINLIYNSNSFFGSMDEVLPYGKNIAATRQIDIGITKTNNTGSTGFGRVATLDFIIVVDIIDGRSENEVQFPIGINGIKAIDANGNIINLSIDQQDATVVIINELSTKVEDNPLNKKINLYPNPAKEGIITVDVQDLDATSVQFYNTLGQLVKTTQIKNSKSSISVADLPTGLYQLEILTTEGVANKKLIVE